MDNLVKLLENYKSGEIPLDKVINELKILPYKDIEFAKIDHHRALRQGRPEVVFCPGKEKEQIVEILKELKSKNNLAIATRADQNTADYIIPKLEDSIYHKKARIISYGEFPPISGDGYALVISAGTADQAIAEEAIIILKSSGVRTETIFDCGVAGIHRIFDHVEKIINASAIVVVAGMEGALASIIGGLSVMPCDCSSDKYRLWGKLWRSSSFAWYAKQLCFIVSVVNIDNGFSAGCIASMIVKQSGKNLIPREDPPLYSLEN